MTLKYYENQVPGTSQQPSYQAQEKLYPSIYANQVQPQLVVVSTAEELIPLTAAGQDATPNADTPKKPRISKKCYCCVGICCILTVLIVLVHILLLVLLATRRGQSYDCYNNPAVTRYKYYDVPITEQVERLHVIGPVSFRFTSGLSIASVDLQMISGSPDVDPSTLYDLQHSFDNGTLFISVTSLVSDYEYCTSASVTVHIPRNANISDVVIDTPATYHQMSPPNSVEWCLDKSALSKPMNSFTVNAGARIYVTDLQSRNITLHTKIERHYSFHVTCNSCTTQQMSIVSDTATIDKLKSFPSTSSDIPTLYVEASFIDIVDAAPAVMNLTATTNIFMTYHKNASFYGTLAFRRTVPSYRSKLVAMDIRGDVSYQLEKDTGNVFIARLYRTDYQPVASHITASLSNPDAEAQLHLFYVGW